MDPSMGRTARAIEMVQNGMQVVDSLGERLGTVEEIRMGDPEAVTTQGNEADRGGLFEAMADAVVGSEPEVPAPLRDRLVRAGYVKIDGPGLTDQDCYVPADKIGSVQGDTVHLTVPRGQLPAEH